MKVKVTKGLVKINVVELSKHHGCMELYIDVDQKYPKVSYSMVLGPGKYRSIIIAIKSYSGRGHISYIELIPEGLAEHKMFYNSWFQLVQVRYCVRYLFIPHVRQSDKWLTLFNNKKEAKNDSTNDIL